MRAFFILNIYINLFSRSVVLAYNMPNINHLNLTRDILVGIYNGTYRKWNDARIQEVNPNNIMPEAEIIVIARTDKSGTTSIFTEGLSAMDANWNSTYGKFSKGLNFFCMGLTSLSTHFRSYPDGTCL